MDLVDRCNGVLVREDRCASNSSSSSSEDGSLLDSAYIQYRLLKWEGRSVR